MGSSSALICEFKESMEKEFEMSDLGLLHYFLGLEVKQTKDAKRSMLQIYSKGSTC